MVPDGRTDGMDGRHRNYIPPTSSGDNKDNFGYLVPTKNEVIYIHYTSCMFILIYYEIGVYFFCHLDNTLDTPFSWCEKS